MEISEKIDLVEQLIEQKEKENYEKKVKAMDENELRKELETLQE